jgi:hypothetical protein
MQIAFRILAGVILLLFGRRLFWLFVGLLGFFAGFTLATRFFAAQEQWITLVIAVVCGLIGILIALFLQRVAIAIAGFLAGGMFSTAVLEITRWQLDPAIAYILCGIIGAILLSIVFEWALIFLSSLTGAMLITRSLSFEPMIETALIVVLVVIGIIVQSRIRTRTVTTTRSA